MDAMVYWYRGPWQWRSDLGMDCWGPPPALVGGLDLRGNEQANTPGFGIFWGHAKPAAVGSDYDLLGAGNWHDIKSTGKMRDAMPQRKGKRPDAPDLVGMLRYLLTEGADPTGDEFAKPLVPNTRKQLELVCGPFRHSEWFDYGKHPHTAMLTDLLHRDFRRIHADATAGKLKDQEHHRRVLDYWGDKYGLEGDAVSLLLPAELKHLNRLKHETSYSDPFTRSDNTSLGANWTEVVGQFSIVSNQIANADTTDNTFARYNSDLSGDDHYAEIDFVAEGGGGTPQDSFVCPAVRCDASSTTYYRGTRRRTAGTGTLLQRLVSGTVTTIVTNATTGTAPYTQRLTIDGSTLTLSVGGVGVLSTTDTNISGHLRTGIGSRGGTFSGTGQTGDNFAASDIGVAGISYTQLERGTRGVMRGVWTGGF